MFNDVKIIWNAESHRVDRNNERASRAMFLQLFSDTNGETMLILGESGARGSRNEATSL